MATRGEGANLESRYIRWLSDLNKSSGPIAGGKGANLAEMFNSKFPVPPAFVVTTLGYNHFIEKAGIKKELFELLDSIDVDDTEDLDEKSKKIRHLITTSEMPSDLRNEIIDSYEALSIDKGLLDSASKYASHILKHTSEPVFVAVRSSATTEDLDDSSFAGQQESYLNIKGNTELINHVKKVLASLFTSRAIYYRKKRGFSNEKFSLAVVVQKMIDSEKSGVMFSKNPVQNTDNIMIEAVFGLGEGIVSGKIKPDNYIVSRELKILETKVAEKKIAIVRDSQGDNHDVKLTPSKSKEQVLDQSEIKSLANYALKLEEHYQKPQDIEFAVESGEIYIVQSRPITTQTKEIQEIKGKSILEGLGASPGIISGKVKIIHHIEQLKKVSKGDILVTEMTNPDMVVAMQRAAAIITDEGGITSHAAIVSREMGIPAVVGTGNSTKKLHEGQMVTVDGFNGMIYEGETKSQLIEIKPIVKTKTKLKLILDIPEAAERAAKTGIEAIGLLRLEGIIASSGEHPLKYQKENKLHDYVKILEHGIEKISKNFNEVWIRTSDIRSDEFSSLSGAPKKSEDNPMLGFHGIRFSLKNPKILEAELTAIKNSAKKYKDKIFGIMIPQVISPEEIKQTRKIARDAGLEELNNIKFGIMVETPAACFIIKDLIREKIEFVSLGTNDLTQYTLAIDRNNENIQDIYRETHPAVLNAIKRVIRTCKEMGVETSICGQAGSNKEMVRYLVENDIDSISVNADAAHEISEFLVELENAKEYQDHYEMEGNEVKEKKMERESQEEENINNDTNREEEQEEEEELVPQMRMENKDNIPPYISAETETNNNIETKEKLEEKLEENTNSEEELTEITDENQDKVLDIF